jgi:hypothetical protein
MLLGELSPEIVHQEKLQGHEHEMLRQEDSHSSERGMVGERKSYQMKMEGSQDMRRVSRE